MKEKQLYIQKYNQKTREICHEIKNRNEICYKLMADFVLQQEIIDKQCILIPAPQHEGYAIYTKKIAELIAIESGAMVLDIIKSDPRKTLYEYKKQNTTLTLNFKLTEKILDTGKNIYLVDNVLHTGQTFLTCQKLIGQKLIPLVYAISK